MQESELDVSKNLREENKMLRNDNDALRDEILELKQRLNEPKKTDYLAPVIQNSGSNSNASKPNYYPGISQNLAEQPREKLSYQRDNSAPAPQ